MQGTNTSAPQPPNVSSKIQEPPKPLPKSPPPPTPPPSVQVLDFGFPAPPTTIPTPSSARSFRRRGREIHPEELNMLAESVQAEELAKVQRDSSCAELRSNAHIKSFVGEVFEASYINKDITAKKFLPSLDAPSPRTLSKEPEVKGTVALELKHVPVVDSPKTLNERPPVPGPFKRPDPPGFLNVNKPLPHPIVIPNDTGVWMASSQGIERSSSESTSKSDHSTISIVPREQPKGVQFEELPRPSASSSKLRLDGNVSSPNLLRKDTSDSISVSSKMSKISAREKFQAGGRSVAKSIKASFASLRSTALSQSPRTMSMADSAAAVTGISTTSSYTRQQVGSQPLPPQFSALPPFTRLDGEFDQEAQFAYGKPKPISLNLRLPKIPSGLRKAKPKQEAEIIHLDYDEMTHAVVTLNPYRIEFILPKSMREQMEWEARNPPPEGLVKTAKREFREIQRDVKRRLGPREPPLPPELGGQDGGVPFALKMEARQAKLQPGDEAATKKAQPIPPAPTRPLPPPPLASTSSSNAVGTEENDDDDRSTIRRKRAQYFKRSTSFPNLRTRPSLISTTSSKRGLRQERGWAGVPTPPSPLNIDPENCTVTDVIESAIEAYLERADSLDQPLVLPLIRPLVIPGKNAPKLPTQAPIASGSESKKESTALMVSKEDLIDAADVARKRQSIRGSVFFDLDLDFNDLEQEQEAAFVDVGTREEASKYVEYRTRCARPINELSDDDLEWIFKNR